MSALYIQSSFKFWTMHLFIYSKIYLHNWQYKKNKKHAWGEKGKKEKHNVYKKNKGGQIKLHYIHILQIMLNQILHIKFLFLYLWSLFSI